MTRLQRGLGPWASASIVIGTIIGTGVFLKTAVMAQLGGSPLASLGGTKVVPGGFSGFGAFGAMVVAALWTYDRWNHLPMAAGAAARGVAGEATP